jgi:hypothetical protein
MNYPTLNPCLLHDFLEELTGFHDKVEIRNPKLVTLIRLIAPPQWHLELPNLLWRIKPWQISQERRTRIQAAAEAYNSIVFERKAALNQLIDGLINQMGIDREQALIVAVKILQNKNVQIANIYGVDLNELPELPSKHHVIEEGKIVYEL